MSKPVDKREQKVNKPIIGPYGEYVTEPFNMEVYAMHANNEGFHKLHYKGNNPEGAFIIHSLIYATREAAEMALIRANCIRRLKELAYGGGWLPKFKGEEVYTIDHSDYYESLYVLNTQDKSSTTNTFFKSGEDAKMAMDTITKEEKEAILYIHTTKEEE